MKKIRITIPNPEAYDYLAANLRRVDLEELAALAPISPRAAMDELAGGEKYVACDENETPIAIFGIREVTPDKALVWFLGTDAVNRYPGEFLRYGRLVIANWLQSYKLIYNFVYGANEPAIRMLARWGFTILPAVPFGEYGNMFKPFFMRAP